MKTLVIVTMPSEEGEMSYWDVPQGRALLRVSAGRPMEGCKVAHALLVKSVVVALPLGCDESAAMCFVPQSCHALQRELIASEMLPSGGNCYV